MLRVGDEPPPYIPYSRLAEGKEKYLVYFQGTIPAKTIPLWGDTYFG